MPKKDPINLGVIDVKWGLRDLPKNAEGVTIESLQLGGPVASAHRDQLQEALISSMFISGGGYIIVKNPDGTIPMQWSEDYHLGKIPGGKKDNSALVELLADAYTDLAPNLSMLKKISKNKLLDWKNLGAILNLDQVIIDSTPVEILNGWLDIVSKSSPWNIDDIKKLAKKSQAKPFIAHWLDIETKAVKDFIQQRKGVNDSDYQSSLDEKQSKSHKKIRNGYDVLFGGKSESIKDAAIREYQEETGYRLEKKHLVPLYVIFETKKTQRGTKYLKKRVIWTYKGELGNQGKLSHTDSEKSQKIELIIDKTASQLCDLLSDGVDKKLDVGFNWKRLIFGTNKRRYKISSAVVTLAIIKYYHEKGLSRIKSPSNKAS